MVSDPPDPGLPLPSVPFLGGQGVQGQEDQCHLGQVPHTPVAPAGKWETQPIFAAHPSALPEAGERGPLLALRAVPGQGRGLTTIHHDGNRTKDAAGGRKGTDKGRGA